MQIIDVVLHDFRGFERQTTALEPDLAVFAGPNGSGKSSALFAIASLIAGVPQILQGHRDALFAADDPRSVRIGASSAAWMGLLQSGEEQTALQLQAGDRLPTPSKQSDVMFNWITQLGDQARMDADTTLPAVSWLHGGSTRSPLASLDPQPLPGRFAAYQGAFDQEALHFDAFQRWFEQEENVENQERIAKRNLKFELPTLRAVRRALETFFEALGDVPFGNFRVVRSHVGGPLGEVHGELTATKGDGVELFVEQLSDGERRLLVLVGDLARRMAILNPHLPDPGQSPGVLVVDEVDLHLHPAWQRTVVPALRKTFPKVQWILSTHSPQVLASVPGRCVVLLEDSVFLPGHPLTEGRDTNTLLQSAFGIGERPEDVLQDLREAYDALDDDPKRARKVFNKLRKKLGADDPDVVRLDALLTLSAA